MSSNLNINPSVTIGGVLDFDGSVYATGNGAIDAEGNKTLRWKMWMDSSIHSNLECLFSFSTVSIDHFNIHFTNTGKFAVYTSNFVSGSISGFTSDTLSNDFYNKVIQCEVKKGTSEFIHFKIDDVSLTGGPGGTQGASGSLIIGSQGAGSFITNATIWDVEYIDDDLVEIVHSWKGYPGGNTDGGWVDDVSNRDLELKTSPASGVPINTRDIQSVPDGGVIDLSNKLSLEGSNGKLLLQGNFIEQPFLTFVTNASTQIFDPGWSATPGTFTWDLGDGSTFIGNAVTHTYTQVGDKEVKIYLGTVPGIEDITNINMYQDNIKGTLDFSEFSELSSVLINENPELTEILMPTTTKSGSSFTASSCDLTGTLDVSGMINLGSLSAGSNVNLTSVLFPSNPSGTTSVNVFNSNLTGPIDISGLDLTGQLTLAANTNMTELLLPSVTTGAVTSVYLYGCPNCYGNAGVFDFSGWTNWSGQLHIGGVDASVVKFPGSSGEFISLNLYGLDIPVLDVSGLTFHPTSGCTIAAQNSPNLSQINWPAGDVIVPSLNISACNFSGTLDLSSVQLSRSGYSSGFLYAYNNNITQILHKDSSSPLEYRVFGNDLTGTLDVSGLTGLYNRFYGYGNENLSRILLPDFSDEWNDFDVKDCSLDQFTVDDIFAKMNTFYSSTVPTQALIIETNGGNNAIPTDGSSNSDILNLETIFTNNLQALTININT